MHLESKKSETVHRERGSVVNLIFSCDSKMRVAVPRSPRQADGRLQALIHFLVDGASKFCTIIPAKIYIIYIYISVPFSNSEK